MPYIGYDPSAPGTISIQRFTAGTDFTAGSSTTLTITYSPGSANNIDIYFDGQYQHHDQWSISGNTITFTAAIPLGTLVVEVKYGNSVAINAPADGTVTLAKLASQTLAGLGQALLINGKITTSVGSNALTIAVKTDAGNDPSPTDPVYVYFRKSTLTDSGFDRVAITTALSMTVSSGSTLGHPSALQAYFFVYLINNGGTAELAVSSLPPDYDSTLGISRLVSTTAEGGAGAADSAAVVYSTTARSNVPWVCVAMLKSTQTTAGTWAAAMTQVDQAPFKIPAPAFRVHRNGTVQNIADNTITVWQGTTEEYDICDGWSTSSYRFDCPVSGIYHFYGQTRANNPLDQMYVGALIYKNNGGHAYGQDRMSGMSADQQVRATTTMWLNVGDYVDMRLLHTRGTSEDFNGGSQETFFTGHRT